MNCSWCGYHYGYRYGWDGKNVFVLTWDIFTLFWFWWHPHFCSTECKLAYQERKGPTGIMRDIDFIKQVIFFFKKLNNSKTGAVRDKTTAEQGFIHKPQQERTVDTRVEFIPTGQNEQKPKEVEPPKVPAGDVSQEQVEIHEKPHEEPAQIVQQPEPDILTEGKSEERFYFLREDDRIHTASKFTERKGFFRKLLPSSWILTIGFYLLISFVVLLTAIMVTPSDNDIALTIVIILFVLVIPVVLLVTGIKKKVKYSKEKKKWSECTGSGKRPFALVLKEFHEMEEEYLNQEHEAVHGDTGI